MGQEAVGYVVVIPTLGRPSLQACVAALAAAAGAPPDRVVLVDDRRGAACPLPVAVPEPLAGRTVTIVTGGRGPSAARNAGWRAAAADGAPDWIVFLDDDVQVGPGWAGELAADLAGLPDAVAGVQGIIAVPRPAGRLPTEWERDVVALETSSWVTADMAYRQAALTGAGGFDERFRAFREDSDLALRLLDQGWELRRGQRRTSHPVRPPGRWPSLAAQARHAEDGLMTSLHGRGWRRRAGEGLGRRPAYVAACGLGGASLALLVAGRRREARLAAAAWLAMTVELAAARSWPGPRTLPDVAEMTVTSAVIPPLAVGHWLAGRRRLRAGWSPRRGGSSRRPGGMGTAAENPATGRPALRYGRRWPGGPAATSGRRALW